MHELTRQDARRIAVRAQLLDASPQGVAGGSPPGPAASFGLLDVVRRLTLLQIDPVAAIAPSADLVAWSRLGSRYDPAELDQALERRDLLELRAMIRPAEDLALYRADMARWDTAERGDIAGWREGWRNWVRANDDCRRDLLRRLTESGPLTSRELPDSCAVPWQSSGWTSNRNVTQLLEFMVERGDVAIAGRRADPGGRPPGAPRGADLGGRPPGAPRGADPGGRPPGTPRSADRLWDLAERVYPDHPVIPAAEALRARNERRLRALGIARVRSAERRVEPDDVGDAGEPAVVEGVKGTWRVDPAQLGQPFAGRAALLSPFDRLIHDRKRTTELFGFDYQLEMYKPAARRRWGYFALPILHADELVGKLDATADRAAGILRVNAIHQDVPFTPPMTEAIDAEITDLARWLSLDRP